MSVRGGTFKKTGTFSVASPDFRLAGRNRPKDPTQVDPDKASARQLLLQLADFSLSWKYIRDSCFLDNPDSDTYSANRAELAKIFQAVLDIRGQPDGWKQAPTKEEVARLGLTPPTNFSRRIADDEYRFAWPKGHPLRPKKQKKKTSTPTVANERREPTSTDMRSVAVNEADAVVRDGDADGRVDRLLAKVSQLEATLSKYVATTDSLEREGAGTSSSAVSLGTGVFSDLLYAQLRQTVSRPLGVAVPDTAQWGPLEIQQEFSNSGLADADRKKILRKYKMDTEFSLLPGQIEEEDRKKLTQASKEKETSAYKQSTLIRDFVRPLLAGLDWEARGIKALLELRDANIPWADWHDQFDSTIGMLYESVQGLKDVYRLLSASFSASERERLEIVMKHIHPQYTLPAQQHKAVKTKLVTEELKTAARLHDEAWFFAHQGNKSQFGSRKETTTRGVKKPSKSNRAKRAARLKAGALSESAQSTEPQSALSQTPGKHQKKGGKVGGQKGAPKNE